MQDYRNIESLEISLVVPVFNESEAVDRFIKKIISLFPQNGGINLDIIFINDGSTDETLEHLLILKHKYSCIRIIDFSRNFGKEAALSAGLKIAKGTVIVPIDVDLQDPPELILPMIAKWGQGYDVVLGRRINRDSDSNMKKVTADLFYWIYNKFAEIKIPNNVGDFRLIDHSVLKAINELSESQRFMKGLLAWVGFKTTMVEYTRPARSAGKTKFNYRKLLSLASNGLTSFSIEPLRIFSYLGLTIALAALIFGSFIVLKTIIYGVDVPGYASLIFITTFLGGIQLIGIGVLGEYMGRAYIESKHRPVYIIKKMYE